MKKSDFKRAMKQGNIKLNTDQGYVTNGYVLIKIQPEMLHIIMEIKGDLETNYDFDQLLYSLTDNSKGSSKVITDTGLLMKSKSLLRIYQIDDKYMFSNDEYMKLFDDIKDPIIESRGVYDPIVISKNDGVFQGIVLPVKIDPPGVLK